MSFGCAPKVFVAERVFSNGGERGNVELENGQVVGSQAGDCIAFFAEDGQTRLTKKDRSNETLLEYGHVEKAKKAVEASRLRLSKSIKCKGRTGGVLRFDEPPEKNLKFMLRVGNSGSATYEGPMKLVDVIRPEFGFVELDDAHRCKTVWLPYIGKVKHRSKVKDGRLETRELPDGAVMVVWSVDNIKLKKGAWLELEIEVTPPPFELQSAADTGRKASTTE